MITIIINDKRYSTEQEALSHGEIVQFTGYDPNYDNQYEVLYSYKHNQKYIGEIIMGDYIRVCDGMNFTVSRARSRQV